VSFTSLKGPARCRHVAQFVEDEQFQFGELALETQELLISGLDQRGHQLVGADEADPVALGVVLGNQCRGQMTFPVPGLPIIRMFSFLSMYWQRMSSTIRTLLTEGREGFDPAMVSTWCWAEVVVSLVMSLSPYRGITRMPFAKDVAPGSTPRQHPKALSTDARPPHVPCKSSSPG